MRLHRIIPAAALVSSVILLGGCSTITNLIGGDQAVRDADTGQVTESGKADAFTIKVGDCFNDQSGEQISDVPAVPCTDPHDNEVYYDLTMPAGDYPGDSAVPTPPRRDAETPSRRSSACRTKSRRWSSATCSRRRTAGRAPTTA